MRTAVTSPQRFFDASKMKAIAGDRCDLAMTSCCGKAPIPKEIAFHTVGQSWRLGNDEDDVYNLFDGIIEIYIYILHYEYIMILYIYILLILIIIITIIISSSISINIVVVIIIFILVTENSHLSHPGKAVLFCFKAAQNVWNNHGPRSSNKKLGCNLTRAYKHVHVYVYHCVYIYIHTYIYIYTYSFNSISQ
jgi:hypothetical protein